MADSFIGFATAQSPRVVVLTRSGTTLTKLSNPASLPANTGEVVRWSPNGEFLAVGNSNTSPYLTVYERSGSTFTKLSNPATLPDDTVLTAEWSPNGQFLAVGGLSALRVYELSGSTLTKIAGPSTMPGGTIRKFSWTPDSSVLAVGSQSSPYLSIYQVSGSGLVDVSDPATRPSKVSYPAFSYDGQLMAVSWGDSLGSGLYLYSVSGTAITKLTDPTQPGTYPAGPKYLEWSANDAYLATAAVNSPYVHIYSRSGTSLTKLPNPADLLTGYATEIAWAPDNAHLAVGHINSPYVTVYEVSGGTATKLPNPGTLPTGTTGSLDWSRDSGYLAIGGSGAPGLLAYQLSGSTLTKLADPSGISGLTANSVRFYDPNYASGDGDSTGSSEVSAAAVAIGPSLATATAAGQSTAPAYGVSVGQVDAVAESAGAAAASAASAVVGFTSATAAAPGLGAATAAGALVDHGSAHITALLPDVSAYATADGNAAVTVALPTVSAFVAHGNMASAAIALQMPQVSVSATGPIEILAPAYVQASGVSGSVAAAHAPAGYQVSAYGLAEMYGFADLVLTQVAVQADGLSEQRATGVVVAPRAVLRATGTAGAVSTATINGATVLVQGSAYGDNIGNVHVLAPSARLEAAGVAVVGGAYNTWALNIRVEGGITSYSGWQHNSMATDGVDTLAAGPDGIVILSGEDDSGSDINAVARTAIVDFGTGYNKRIARAYAGLRASGSMRVSTITTQDGARAYPLPYNGNPQTQQRRVKIGAGPKARFWQFQVENVDGCDFSLTDLSVLPVNVSRRVI